MSALALKWYNNLRFTHPELWAKMSPSAKLVLKDLCERQSDFGDGPCRGSHHEIALAQGLSDKHVSRMVQWLIDHNALIRVEQDRDEQGNLRKISWTWGFRYEFGLGFVFQPAQNHPRRSRTFGPLIPDISSPDPRHPVPSDMLVSLLENQKHYKPEEQNQVRGKNRAAPPSPDRASHFAERLLHDAEIGVTPVNKIAAKAALECEIRQGYTLQEAYRTISQSIRRTRDIGVHVDRWFFEDAKWRLSDYRPITDYDEWDYEQRLKPGLMAAQRAGADSEEELLARACQSAGMTLERGREVMEAHVRAARAAYKKPPDRAVNE